MTQKEKQEKQLNETLYNPIKELVLAMEDQEKKGEAISELNKIGFLYSCSRYTVQEVAFLLGTVVERYSLNFKPSIDHKD